MSGDERSWADAPYTRIYHSIAERMGDRWDDVAFVGAWTKLTVAADATYPLAAPLPRWLPDAMLESLLESGLVRLVGPSSYTIAGLAKERTAQRGGRAIGGRERERQATRDGAGRFLPSLPSNDSSNGPSKPPSSAQQTPASRPATSQQADAGEPRSASYPSPSHHSPKVPSAHARSGSSPSTSSAWEGWDPAWVLFRAAWTARGLRKPPTEKQREALWDAVEARPSDVARWVAAPPPDAPAGEVVRAVLEGWHALRAEAGTAQAGEATRWAAMAEDPTVSPVLRAEAKATLAAIERRIGEATP